MHYIYKIYNINETLLYYMRYPLSLAIEETIEGFFIHTMYLNNCIKKTVTKAQ